MNAREFEAAAEELGYSRVGDVWRHPFGPRVSHTSIVEIVGMHGRTSYAEYIDTMRQAIPSVVDMIAKLA